MAIPNAVMSRRRYGAGKLWAAPLGTIWSPSGTTATPLVPVGTGNAFTQGTTGATVPGSTAWLPLGITTDGTDFSFGFDTDEDMSAEYYNAHRIVVTSQTASASMTLKQVNVTNLRLAMNMSAAQVLGGAGAVTPSGVPSATAAARLSMPLPGQESRCQLMWESNDNDMLVVGYSAFQTNEFHLTPNKGVDGLSLELEFTFEQPSTAISAQPVDIWVIGTSWAETVATD